MANKGGKIDYSVFEKMDGPNIDEHLKRVGKIKKREWVKLCYYCKSPATTEIYGADQFGAEIGRVSVCCVCAQIHEF